MCTERKPHRSLTMMATSAQSRLLRHKMSSNPKEARCGQAWVSATLRKDLPLLNIPLCIYLSQPCNDRQVCKTTAAAATRFYSDPLCISAELESSFPHIEMSSVISPSVLVSSLSVSVVKYCALPKYPPPSTV